MLVALTVCSTFARQCYPKMWIVLLPFTTVKNANHQSDSSNGETFSQYFSQAIPVYPILK